MDIDIETGLPGEPQTKFADALREELSTMSAKETFRLKRDLKSKKYSPGSIKLFNRLSNRLGVRTHIPGVMSGERFTDRLIRMTKELLSDGFETYVKRSKPTSGDGNEEEEDDDDEEQEDKGIGKWNPWRKIVRKQPSDIEFKSVAAIPPEVIMDAQNELIDQFVKAFNANEVTRQSIVYIDVYYRDPSSKVLYSGVIQKDGRDYILNVSDLVDESTKFIKRLPAIPNHLALDPRLDTVEPMVDDAIFRRLPEDAYVWLSVGLDENVGSVYKANTCLADQWLTFDKSGVQHMFASQIRTPTFRMGLRVYLRPKDSIDRPEIPLYTIGVVEKIEYGLMNDRTNEVEVKMGPFLAAMHLDNGKTWCYTSEAMDSHTEYPSSNVYYTIDFDGEKVKIAHDVYQSILPHFSSKPQLVNETQEDVDARDIGKQYSNVGVLKSVADYVMPYYVIQYAGGRKFKNVYFPFSDIRMMEVTGDNYLNRAIREVESHFPSTDDTNETVYVPFGPESKAVKNMKGVIPIQKTDPQDLSSIAVMEFDIWSVYPRLSEMILRGQDNSRMDMGLFDSDAKFKAAYNKLIASILRNTASMGAKNGNMQQQHQIDFFSNIRLRTVKDDVPNASKTSSSNRDAPLRPSAEYQSIRRFAGMVEAIPGKRYAPVSLGESGVKGYLINDAIQDDDDDDNRVKNVQQYPKMFDRLFYGSKYLYGVDVYGWGNDMDEGEVLPVVSKYLAGAALRGLISELRYRSRKFYGTYGRIKKNADAVKWLVDVGGVSMDPSIEWDRIVTAERAVFLAYMKDVVTNSVQHSYMRTNGKIPVAYGEYAELLDIETQTMKRNSSARGVLTSEIDKISEMAKGASTFIAVEANRLRRHFTRMMRDLEAEALEQDKLLSQWGENFCKAIHVNAMLDCATPRMPLKRFAGLVGVFRDTMTSRHGFFMQPIISKCFTISDSETLLRLFALETLPPGVTYEPIEGIFVNDVDRNMIYKWLKVNKLSLFSHLRYLKDTFGMTLERVYELYQAYAGGRYTEYYRDNLLSEYPEYRNVPNPEDEYKRARPANELRIPDDEYSSVQRDGRFTLLEKTVAVTMSSWKVIKGTIQLGATGQVSYAYIANVLLFLMLAKYLEACPLEESIRTVFDIRLDEAEARKFKQSYSQRIRTKKNRAVAELLIDNLNL